MCAKLMLALHDLLSVCCVQGFFFCLFLFLFCFFGIDFAEFSETQRITQFAKHMPISKICSIWSRLVI